GDEPKMPRRQAAAPIAGEVGGKRRPEVSDQHGAVVAVADRVDGLRNHAVTLSADEVVEPPQAQGDTATKEGVLDVNEHGRRETEVRNLYRPPCPRRDHPSR